MLNIPFKERVIIVAYVYYYAIMKSSAYQPRSIRNRSKTFRTSFLSLLSGYDILMILLRTVAAEMRQNLTSSYDTKVMTQGPNVEGALYSFT